LIGGCDNGRRFCNFFGLYSVLELALADVDFEVPKAVLSEASNRGKLFLTDFRHDFVRFSFSSLAGSFSILSIISDSAPATESGVPREPIGPIRTAMSMASLEEEKRCAAGTPARDSTVERFGWCISTGDMLSTRLALALEE
jgi:hypothetical protein